MPTLPPGVAQEHAAGPELHERGRDEQQPVTLGHAHAQRLRPEHQGHDADSHGDRDDRADAEVTHLAGAQVGVRIGLVERERGRLRGDPLGPHVVAGRFDG